MARTLIQNKPEDFTPEQLNRIDRLAGEAWDKPWWREVMKLINAERQKYLDQLVLGAHDQRTEDQIRGHISFANFILTLDEFAHQKNVEKTEDAERDRQRVNVNNKQEDF